MKTSNFNVGIRFHFLYVYKFLLASLYLLFFFQESSAQTLSNLSLLQRKRLEVAVSDLDKFVGTAGNNFLEHNKDKPEEIVNTWQRASRYVRDHPEEIAKYLEMHSQYGDLLALDPGSDDPKIQAFAYTVLALQKKEVLEKYYTEKKLSAGSEQRKDVESEVGAIKATINRIASPTVTVFASGNIRSIATSNATDPVASGTGSIGAAFAGTKHAVSAHLSVASTQDTIQSNYGSLILAPSNGKTLKSALIEWYPRIKNDHWGHLYTTFASSFWKVDADSLGNATAFRSASTLGVGALYHYRVFNGHLAETEVGLDVEIGLAGRWLHGDIRNMLNDSLNKAKYLKVFPSERNFYTGLEGGLTFNFGQVVGALQAFYLFPKEDEPIDGLTGLQISVGLSVRGDIIRGFLNNKK